VQYSKFIEHLKNTRKFLRWTLDKEGALRGTLLPHLQVMSNPSNVRFQEIREAYLTPVTSVCYALTGKYYKSLNAAYAASEIDLDQSTSRSIERASDDVGNTSEGELLVNLLNPVKL